MGAIICLLSRHHGSPAEFVIAADLGPISRGCDDSVMAANAPAVRAIDAGIKKLNHDDRLCPKYLTDMLAMRRIHFSNPQNFNDPWDCYPCLDATRAGEPEYRAKCIEVFRQQPLPNLTASELDFYERGLQASPKRFIQMLQTEFREAIRSMVVERWRIYCLTQKKEMPLMWSHYANNHEGICLEFDTSAPVFGNAFKVQYEDTLPTLDILDITGEPSFRILVTKARDWDYEQEYRILAREKRVDEPSLPPVPTTTNDFLPLTPGALTGIIVGCRADFKAIEALVKKHAPDLPVQRAIQSTDTYTLSVQC